jgi:hypothetical protein
MATVTAVDLAWVVLGRSGWESAAYTAGVLMIAFALALSMHRVARLPRVASVAAIVLAVLLTNAALLMSGAVLAQLGQPLPTVALLCLAGATAAVLLTVLVIVAAERTAHRRAEIVGPAALPTAHDLISATKIDPAAPTAPQRPAPQQPTPERPVPLVTWSVPDDLEDPTLVEATPADASVPA